MKRFYPLAFLFVLLAYACSQPEAPATKYEWNIEISNGDYNQPVSKVTLLIDNQSYLISEQIDAPMELIEPAKYKEKGVPDSALLACGGFWAGFEQIIFLRKKQESVEVMLYTFEEGFDTAQEFSLKVIDYKKQ